MRVERFATAEQLADAAAAVVADSLLAKPQLVLGLPTGRTPLPVYRRLRERTTRGELAWIEVRTFNVDELLTPGRPGVFESYLCRELLDPVGVPASGRTFLDGAVENAVAESRRFQNAMDAARGLDLLLLGLGVNGHIGFIEPAESLALATHVVQLSEDTRSASAWMFDGDQSQVPRRAITLGMAAMLNARAVLVIATGGAKAEAVRLMTSGRVTTQVPASFLQLHSNATLMVDAAAAPDVSP